MALYILYFISFGSEKNKLELYWPDHSIGTVTSFLLMAVPVANILAAFLYLYNIGLRGRRLYHVYFHKVQSSHAFAKSLVRLLLR